MEDGLEWGENSGKDSINEMTAKVQARGSKLLCWGVRENKRTDVSGSYS